MKLARTIPIAMACLAATVLFAVGASAAHAADFTNSQQITISDLGRTQPYPSSIDVSGLGAPASKVTLTIDLEHSSKSDLEMLLVGPRGQKVLVMSDAAGSSGSPVTWTFDDAAATGLTCGDAEPEPPSGTYRPTNCERFPGDSDALSAPAPQPPYDAGLAAFNGRDPNGIWKLYVDDVGSGDDGILKSWKLSIEAPRRSGGGGPPPPGSDGGPMADTTAPRLGPLSVAPGQFAVAPLGRAGQGPGRRAAPSQRRRRVATSTVFRFRLSERSRIVFSFQRKVGGRRWLASGRFARRGSMGANRQVFRGRIGRRALRPGFYRVRALATDQAGNRSRLRGAGFRIVRRR